jgi:hypothetical protein
MPSSVVGYTKQIGGLMNQFLEELILELEDIVLDVQEDAGYDTVAEHKIQTLIKRIEDELQS